jgi:phage baseplate assembly protein V
MVMQALEERIAALEARVNQMVRVGVVTSVYDAAGTVRVRLPDSAGVISKPLRVLFAKTRDNKSYDMPDVGEEVLCIFLPIGLQQGFVLGAMYSSEDLVPVTDRDKVHYKAKDGTFFEYDRENHKLTIDVQGDIEMNATGNFKLQAARVDLN